ncbi:MAG: hypothetical protein H0A75_00115 [Candidatus Methanofishera endochildressiae]|uniref:Uncharacterized protein n=1 Tax=Candidatus Methanofishera endochildressiae TaxID=2738884 RepID=A0A7Z0MML9_9GAMM|nr:hypothetical protein [Candidatus Methanofishera endochildressiae]
MPDRNFFFEKKGRLIFKLPLSKVRKTRGMFCSAIPHEGNTEWHYRAVANIYNIDVVISPSPARNPNVFVISFFALKQLGVPYQIPHKLGEGRHIEKIKSIYAAMKPAQCKILYVPLGHSIGGTDTTDRIPSSVPHYLGIKSGETTIFDETPKPRIKFCEGLTEQ